MAPSRTLQELRMITEVEIEIGRAFEFQYNTRIPEQKYQHSVCEKLSYTFQTTVYQVGTADYKTRNLNIRATALNKVS
ncbi:hypothetical protein T4D_6467 [Trichinella pseudospiralis]|uniref:Uncharacterized protein n=1 Tax=Trichinella pseudospiralis TaxID=6337 RepID=A0A0V1F5F6_TRIPS|nr:hypothetical protein T4D_6467 [Trichinella pseudospiralis]